MSNLMEAIAKKGAPTDDEKKSCFAGNSELNAELKAKLEKNAICKAWISIIQKLNKATQDKLNASYVGDTSTTKCFDLDTFTKTDFKIENSICARVSCRFFEQRQINNIGPYACLQTFVDLQKKIWS